MQYLYNFAMSHPGIFMIMFVFMCAAFSTWKPISISKHYHYDKEELYFDAYKKWENIKYDI